VKPKKKPGRQVDPATQELIQRFLDMAPGHSFFVEGLTRLDLEFLRKPASRAKVGIRIAETLNDEIYGVAGTRVWRIAGEYDEL
jgi:hypothetical protein